MDGVDLYWLGPGIEDTEEAKANFDSFLIELRERLPTKKISVTVSRDPEVILNAYNFSTIIKKANFINVATYDYHTFKDGVTGYHAPLFSQDNQNSVNTTVTALLEAGVPKHKIVVGFSTRAQTYLVQEDDAPPGTPIVGTPTLQNENDVEGTFEHYKGLWVSASKLGGVMLQVFPVIPQCLLQCFYCGNFTVFEALHDGMRTCPGEAMEALEP
ncbi:hypothetical protein B566_EDAN009509 [Ephemera danica]|nr:hypothetical protein B566_EDAN009509 [Ephemera danica]